jgi:hypothetical protein
MKDEPNTRYEQEHHEQKHNPEKHAIHYNRYSVGDATNPKPMVICGYVRLWFVVQMRRVAFHQYILSLFLFSFWSRMGIFLNRLSNFFFREVGQLPAGFRETLEWRLRWVRLIRFLGHPCHCITPAFVCRASDTKLVS